MEIYYEKDGGNLQYCGVHLTSDHSRQRNLPGRMKLSIPELKLDIYIDNSIFGEEEIEKLENEIEELEEEVACLEEDLKAAERKIEELEENT